MIYQLYLFSELSFNPIFLYASQKKKIRDSNCDLLIDRTVLVSAVNFGPNFQHFIRKI